MITPYDKLSYRLKKVIRELATPKTGLQLMKETGLVAVGSAIADLRKKGYTIDCDRYGDSYLYTLITEEQGSMF